MNEATKRVLIIEDDRDIASLEELVLKRAGYETRTASTGNAGLKMLGEFKPEVVLLDIGLPDMSGLEVCESIAAASDSFILFVSGHASEQYKLSGLGLGADDFITKPFSAGELVARVGSFLRRRDRQRAHAGDDRVACGDAVLVRDRHVLERGAVSAPLTALEFRLLWFLASAEGKLLTRAQILEHVWNDVSGVPTRVVDVHVASLRKKLAEVGTTAAISSVRGIGYRLDVTT